MRAAWNCPLARVRAERQAKAASRSLVPLVMRDTDQGLKSVVVVRADSPFTDVRDLAGETVGVGAVDSPQATQIPRAFRKAGLRPGEDIGIRRFDVGMCLNGDHIGGERDAARALAAGETAAARMIDGNHLPFGQEGVTAQAAEFSSLHTRNFV